ncbi:hypothetical protein KY343_03855 [Candidatus Woesearchaeota archaeon]|nr:hypothetical protein [Candidatus Woesearchaeota archaeon]
MFSKKEIKTLSNELVSLLKKIDYVDLFCFHGSRAAGRAAKDSDLDYYILFRGNFKKRIPKLFDLIGKETSLDKKDYFLKNDFVDFYGTHFVLQGKKVSIHFLEANSFEKYLKSLFKNEKMFNKYQPFVKGWIVEAIPLYDPKNLFIKFKKYVKFDIKFQKEAINKKLNLIKLMLPYAEKEARKNLYIFYHNLNCIINLIIDILYLKNKSFQISYFKALKNDIKKFKPNIEKELLYLIEKPNKEKYLKNKISIIKRIVKKLK